MLKNRVIPVLLIEDDGLVKTTKFKKPKYLGDPVNTVKIFNTKEVDEIFILDIVASKNKSGPNFSLILEIASEAFMPLCYGGGIRNINDAEKLFSLGVEKISIQTSAFKDLELVKNISQKYGSQAVVVSIDLKRDLFGKIKIFNNSYKENWISFAKDAVNAGAGEIFINSVNQDGTLSGPDLELITKLTKQISVPLTYAGGISSLNDIKKVADSGASGIAAGAFFVFHGPNRAVLISYPDYRELQNTLKQ
jgi:imidazole glycerol-phosphate synthase subunit HisF